MQNESKGQIKKVMHKVVKKEIDFGGRKLILETGELANHANAAVMATYGETVVLATVVSQQPSVDLGYFPLAVDFEEKLYAGGKISTSRFIKREGRPSETSILTGRLIDRSIRPLFPTDYQAEVQVIITVLSFDTENDPDVISLIAASAALSISDVPWHGPIAGIRVGSKDDKFILNATEVERETLDFEILLATSIDEIVMIEAEGKEADEKRVADAFKFALEKGNEVIKLIEELKKEAGREKQKYISQKLSEAEEKTVSDFIQKTLMANFDRDSQEETWFKEALKKLHEEFIPKDDTASKLDSEGKNIAKILGTLLEDAVAGRLRDEILKNKKRPDGRAPDQIRELNIKAGILPRTHGSAIFQRGETQVLAIATLASPALQQLIEGMYGESTKRYMHHYNFPPFSTGEVKRMMSPGRREIGHGVLAEKALIPVLPDTDTFPYTIRVVSEVLSSAGSTSQASVCASTLALMDAGVPIKEPVAGISIGLITDSADKNKYVTITDIAYQEDAQGDMDFKVAGTKNGITAIQMDIKLHGISLAIATEALEKAKTARLEILKSMLAVIAKPRDQISKFAPTVILVKIDPSKIGDIIGSGGRTINKIIAETGAQLDVDDDGTVMISGKDAAGCQKAAQWVEGIVKEAQPGEVYEATVKRILPFGAMVEILPGKEGLVHISKLANHRVEKVEDVVNIGDKVTVRVAEIDDMGRVNLVMNSLSDEDLKAKGSGSGDFKRPERSSGGRFERGDRGRDSRPRR